jgi:serine phosphatase RsbU (regulator of sigma subunit)
VDETLELQQQIVRLQALFEASRRIHSTIQLDEVLSCALEIVVRELEMDGAFFSEFPFSAGAVDHTRNCIRFPLTDKAGATISDLVVIPRDDATLTLEESDFLESLAIQTAVAIENARNHERIVHMQRVEQDLASARAIQRSLMPQDVRKISGYQTGMRSVSCYEVGGDYLDVVSLPSGEQIMIVADVAGKGLASAMIASSFRAAFRAMVIAGLPLVNVAVQLNALHFAEGPEARRRYVTALLLRLDPGTNTIEVVNAGHNAGFLRHGLQRACILLEASGTPIGLLPFAEYTNETHELGPGARLLAYTDGLTEVFQGEEEFGLDRLRETFLACPSETAEAALDHIWNTIEGFSTGEEQCDDMTALVLLRD